MRRFGALGCFLPVFKNGSPRLRSIAANHSLGSEIIGSSSTPSGTRRTRTASPSKRNSRGSRTAWLRPLRNNFATPLLAIGALLSMVYTMNLYQWQEAGWDRRMARTKNLLQVQRLQLRIHQERIVKLRHFAPALAKNGQQPRRKWLAPLERQARHVSDDQRKLLRADVAREWNSVQAGAAYRRITEQRINGNVSFAPPLRQPRIFQDGKHQSGISRLFHFHIFNGGGNRRGGRQRSTHAERQRGQIFDSRTDGNIS